MTHYRNFWIKNYEDNAEDYNEILAMDPFELWERNTRPESTAEGELLIGLQLLYSQAETSKAAVFLERCLAVVKHTLAEDKFNNRHAKISFPLNKGHLLRAGSYAQALLGQVLDTNLLLQACVDIEKGGKVLHKGVWDDMAQADYLASVRLALIGGDLKKAYKLLQRKSVFNFHPEQYYLYQNLVNPKIENAELFRQFDDFFDIVRDPNFNPNLYIERDVLRFELGIIREKFFTNPYKEINWRNVIEAVSA